MKRIPLCIEGYMCICTDKYVTIVDSNKVPNSDIPRFVKLLRIKIKNDTNFKYKRSEESWIKEWRAHNKIYKMGMFRSHTKDVDFDEDESKIRLIAYEIFGKEKRNSN